MLDRILSLIYEKLHTKTGTFTLNSGWTGDEIEVKQFGDVIMVKGYFTRSGGTGTNEIAIGTLSGVALPSSHIRFRVGAGNAAYNATLSGYGILAKSGQLSVKLPSSQTTVTIALVYISWGGVLLNPHFSTLTAIFQKIGGGLDAGQDTLVYCKQTGRCSDLLRTQCHKSERQEKGRFGLYKFRNRCSVRSWERTIHSIPIWWKRGSAVLHPIQLRSHLDKVFERFNLGELGKELTISERGWAVC